MKQLLRLSALLVVFGLVAAACGGDDDDNGSGGSGSLSGVSVTVSGKEFTEQLILGQILVNALEDAGANVNDQTAIFGSANTRAALESGDVDMYWEYTGTAWSVHLAREIGEAPADPVELYNGGQGWRS